MPLLSPANGGYLALFGALVAACAGVVYMQNRNSTASATTAEFKGFQRSFLLVFFLASMSDWLQGPYVYALYASYNFSAEDIGILFIAGFGASLLLGTFVAGLGDRYGRALNCKLFAVIYIGSCLTKHFNNFEMLLLGRVLGGMATSILYSSFESWMVSAHNKAAYPKEWLDETFTLMTFCSGVAAILAGVTASVADSLGGPVAPFDVSAVVLVAVFLLVSANWEENKGVVSEEAASLSNTLGSFSKGIHALITNEKIALLGLVQSLYEGAMFIFVFMWTPALEGAAALLAVPILAPDAPMVLMLAFCGFEVVCGMYFPLVGIQRSAIVPEEIRSTLMNLFRVGLNVVVMAVLLNIGSLSHGTVFTTCVLFMAAAAAAQARLAALSDKTAPAPDGATPPRSPAAAGEQGDAEETQPLTATETQ